MSNSRPFARLTPLLGHQSRFRLLLIKLPGLLTNPQKRLLLRQMRRLDENLPSLLASPPIAVAMDGLVIDIDTPRPAENIEREIREMAGPALSLNCSPRLGYCLRRSLVRCYYLRQAGLPVTVHFGARFIAGKPDREITGHAWLTLDNKPCFESAENWRDFTSMMSFPQVPK